MEDIGRVARRSVFEDASQGDVIRYESGIKGRDVYLIVDEVKKSTVYCHMITPLRGANALFISGKVSIAIDERVEKEASVAAGWRMK